MTDFGMRAYELYKNLGRLTEYFVNGIPLTGHPWAEPSDIRLLDYDAGDELYFKWWNGSRTLTIYVDEQELYALMTDIDTEETPDMELENIGDFTKVWIWLHNKEPLEL